MMPSIRWLEPTDPVENFPDPEQALDEPDGLLAMGGNLSVARLLAAYRRGIFPWSQDEQPILWWSPNPRAVLFPRELRISRSLRRTIRRDRYTVSTDQAFTDVIANCAESRSESGTWITPDMKSAYLHLYEHGDAHSIETWLNGNLVGGLYGIAIGRMFFGESMFSHSDDASKVALAKLVSICGLSNIELIDCQIASSHLASLGSRLIPRAEFLRLLARLIQFPTPNTWESPPQPTSKLLS